MGGIEFNKIFAAILVAGITAMLAGFVAEKFVHAEKLKENAYKIEGVEAASTGGAPAMPEPILAMLADADVARGQKLSKACAACHSFDKGGVNGVGPNLYKVVGTKKQSHADFSYSGALNQNGEEVWTYESLNKFLWKPKAYAPGTKMNYIGIKKPEDRAAIIAWLRTLSPSPIAFPGAVAIAAEQAELALPEFEATEVNNAVDTLKSGVEEEQKSLDKTNSDIKMLEIESKNKQHSLDGQKKNIKQASDKIKETVDKANQ